MNAHGRIIRRLLDALDYPWACAYIGVACAALAYVLLVWAYEPFSGGAL
jgi:hypothetical protein